MTTWRWTVKLIELGHRFRGGEWRCCDCRRGAFDLLKSRAHCVSPTFEGEYVFVGGPLDGEWLRVPDGRQTVEIPIPQPLDLRVAPDDEEEIERITYVRQRVATGKPVVAYVYAG